MDLRKILSLLFIIVLATQVLPIGRINLLMKEKADITMIEELNENHNSQSNNNLNECEHKLMSVVPIDFYLTSNDGLFTRNQYNEFRFVIFSDPFIETTENPPNFS